MPKWGIPLPPFVDPLGNRRFPREQEGFARAVNVPEGEVPRCGSVFSSHSVDLTDFRGGFPDAQPFHQRTTLIWETSPAESEETTIFTWIGGSQVYPSMRPAFPFTTALLFVNGVPRLKFELGRAESFIVVEDGFTLWFEPRRVLTLVEEPDRSFSPHGVSGFYRLEVPGELLTPGMPLQLSVELPAGQPDYESFFYVSPRTDALQLSLATHRDEITQLQADVVQLKRSHEMLYAQLYPQFFPDRVQGERVIAHMSAVRHMHPPSLTVMRDGEIVVTFRDAFSHLDVDGRMMLIRSRDKGRTWSEPQTMFDLPRSDHRSSPIVELPNGDWVTLDYRAGGEYLDNGACDEGGIPDKPTLWGAWSTDRGAHWTFSHEPLVNPDSPNRYAEAERHIIRLPSGRLLAAANTVSRSDDECRNVLIAIFASDDDGRHWHYLSNLPLYRYLVGEPTMLRGDNGRIVLLGRSVWHYSSPKDEAPAGMLIQYSSDDDGLTWSEGKPTAMSSQNTPAHLLRLQDGRYLCTHASRKYPASVYVTVSEDEGETWRTDRTKIITNDLISYDSTYPTSGQLADGTLITVWYGSLFGKFFIAGLIYAPEEFP
jgi:hypothetical protein